MAKAFGLSQNHVKYFKVSPFPKEMAPCAALLWHQAKSFFRVFELAFGEGSKTIRAFNNESKTFSEHTIGNTDDFSVALVNYHFSIEMMLKSLICLKEGSLEKNLEIHDLTKLLSKARSHYSALSKIEENIDYKQILQELSTSFKTIRYAEGTIFLSHNKREGWKTKAPLQELSEMLDNIFVTLNEIFEEARKQTKAIKI